MSYSMSDLLELVVAEGASDLHLRVGEPPVIRLHAVLHRVKGPALRKEDTEELMRSITPEVHIQHVRERGDGDFGFALGKLACFGVSDFKEQDCFGVVAPVSPNSVYVLLDVGLVAVGGGRRRVRPPFACRGAACDPASRCIASRGRTAAPAG